MNAKNKAVAAYAVKNFLIVYGHQEQIKDAFGAGWDAAMDYLANLPFDKMLEEFEMHLEHKEER